MTMMMIGVYLVREGGGRRGDSHIKRTGMLIGNFKKKVPLRGTKILFCECGLKFFSSIKGSDSKTTHYLL